MNNVTQSVAQELDVAISVLALITHRPRDLDKLLTQRPPVLGDDGSPQDDLGEQGHESLDEIDADDTGFSSPLDPDSGRLRSKMLDRLAETLARYKTEPWARNRPDAKHVASAMMVVNERLGKVKIFCSKNEGLDQGRGSEDTEFLARWGICMERVASQGQSVPRMSSLMLIYRPCDIER